MNFSKVFSAVFLFSSAATANAQPFVPIPAFPLNTGKAATDLRIERPAQPTQPFTVAGERGVLVGTQDGTFESWVLPVKLLSHLTLEAQVEGYSVPIAVNSQAASIEVVPDHTTITYSHIGFTIRQIMFVPNDQEANTPGGGPVVLFQIDSPHAVDLTFRFTPEVRWMWPRRNDGIPGPEWVARDASGKGGYYVLHMDYPDLAGAVTIPGAEPGILAPYQERPQVHPLELKLHYDPKIDREKFFPLLMAVGTTAETAQNGALGQALEKLNGSIAGDYAAHGASYQKLLAETTSIETPDKALNEAFRWGVVSIEQLKTYAYPNTEGPGETALVAGYYASGDSARPGFGWFFGRDSLYTLYAVNGFGDFALTRSELEFLMARQRADGKIMHEFSQTGADPSVNWKSFPYMYAAADATPLFLMTVRDYLRASGDLAFVTTHRDVIEKAWAFETAPSSDSDGDGIYDNSQGTGWVESWPGGQPHQEVYLALLDQQASSAFAGLETALGDQTKAESAQARAARLKAKIEATYFDTVKGCYAFSRNADGTLDRAITVYPAIAWWDTGSELDHSKTCLQQWAGPAIATDWGLRDVATTEPFYDGASYHQGSVWPLFTGWGALAEYRANQPLPAQQMLMQNKNLTWAQDPGAVTELLSGDYFVPFGRSTSHQLWSSAMVITPTLRGLFGIEIEAATNTITVNPHLPADWNNAEVKNLRVGNHLILLNVNRESGALTVRAETANLDAGSSPSNLQINLRSDISGASKHQIQSKPNEVNYSEMTIPLPPIELVLPRQDLPIPGARTEQFKVLSTSYDEHKLTAVLVGKSDAEAVLYLRQNSLVGNLKIDPGASDPNATLRLSTTNYFRQPNAPAQPLSLDIRFPKGDGWQTTKVTLTW